VLFDYRGETKAVLVSDLASFTSTTRKHGIVHFASIILRMRQVTLPIFRRLGCLHVQTEGDDFIAVFPDAVAGALAAAEMREVIRVVNAELTPGRQHFRITLNGIAVVVGDDVVVDVDGNLHGQTYRLAYEMGEDKAEGGEVVVSCKLAAELRRLRPPAFKDCKYEPFGSRHQGNDDDFVELEHVELNDGQPITVVPTSDVSLLPASVQDFTSRYSRPDTDLEQHDAALKMIFLRPRVVVMLRLYEDAVAEQHGARRALEARHEMVQEVIAPVVDSRGGTSVEEALVLFDSPEDAVRACLDMQRACDEHTGKRGDSWYATVTGYGVHVGPVLFVKDADVHWGDPVNTASKLGEDIAADGELLITSEIHASLAESGAARGLQFAPRTFHKSGVELEAFLVTRQAKGGCCDAFIGCWRNLVAQDPAPRDSPEPRTDETANPANTMTTTRQDVV
jgi:class 3 adenylate cyclase